MTGQKADVILCILIHAPSFGDNIADVFVVFLQTRLLIGHIGITIKDLCPAGAGLIFLYVPWILKFRTVVSENDGEILFKVRIPMAEQRLLMASVTLFCVQSGSRMRIMKEQLLNNRVRRHLPLSRLPFTVSISTTSSSGKAFVYFSKSM